MCDPVESYKNWKIEKKEKNHLTCVNVKQA